MVYRSSEQTFMANTLSSTSTLPWIWCVEALASSNQADTPLLIDLLKRIPEISDDLGESAREMVSFRALENLFSNKSLNKDDKSLAAGPRIRFEPSERCEHVLLKILQEISASNMKMYGPHMLKWDIQPFIAYKRSTLPRCALLQLKDMIVKGTDPRLAPLKERSGLSTTDQSGKVTSVDGIAVDDTKEIHEENNSEHLAQNGNLEASIQGNENNGKENLPDQNLRPAKKRKNISDDYKGRESPEERIISENNHDPCIRITKKSKLRVELDKDCEHITGYIEKQGCNLENGCWAGGLEESGSPTRQSHGDRQQHLCKNSEMPQGMDEGRGVKNNCINAAGEECALAERRNSNDGKQPSVQQVSYASETERNFEHNLSNGGPTNQIRDNIDTLNEPEPCSDNDEYHEERTEIASRKTAFLSSQCTYSQDSFATTDLSELNLCMKCNRGGQLLVCSSETCPLVVHDSCLGSAPNFEKDGKFYCPFCAYSRAISEYKEARKKASLARKDFAAFIALGIEQPLKNSSARSIRSKTSQSRQNVESCEIGEANSSRNSLNAINSPQCRANTEDKQQENPPVTSAGGCPPSKDKRILSTSGAVPVILAKHLQENQAEQDTLSPKRDDNRHNETLAITVHHMHVLPCGDPEVSNRDEACIEDEVEKENVSEPGTSLHHQLEPAPSIDVEESSDGEKGNQPEPTQCIDVEESSDEGNGNQPEPTQSSDVEESSDEGDGNTDASKYCIMFHKKPYGSSHPATPQWRRKKVLWSKEEEEALKDGVEKFTSSSNRNIMPWREILEFGGDRFWKGRTAVDLKDKWRNICKASPKAS